MKKLKYLLLIFIIFITPNVFAAETNVSNKIRYAAGEPAGTYYGNNIATGTSRDFSIGSRYNGRLSLLTFYISSDDYDFLINHTYSITLNMATQDWRNHFMGPQVIKANSNGSLITNGSLSVSNFRFVSYKQIKFNFTTNSSISPYYFFRLYSSDYASNNTIAITGDNNWALSSIIINDQVSTSGSGSSGSSGAGSSINNNTLSCNDGLTITSTTYNDSNSNITGSYINSSGNLVSNSGYNVINYIPIKTNTNYQIKKTTNTGDVPSYCLSTNTSSYGSCSAYNANSTFTFNSGNNSYLSLSIKPDETIYLSYCASSIEIANQNTQNIIDNANQNSSDIIDNANQNTQNIINSNKVCTSQHIDKTQVDTTGYYLASDGSLSSWGGYGVTSYIPITQDSELTMTTSITGVSYFCFYNENKVKITCLRNSEQTVDNIISIPSYTAFVRFSIFTSSNIPTFTIKTCKNGNQAISDVLNDDSNPNIADSEFTNLFNTVGFNDPLSYLLQLPVQFINQLVSQSNTCQTISLGNLWGVSLSLPCINIGSIIGQQVWDIIDVLFSVGLLVVIFKNLYQTFANLMTMGGEKEAREKFSMPTPMEFLSIILGGDR